MSAQVVQAGACIDMNDSTFSTFTCVLERTACPPDQEYHSSRHLDQDSQAFSHIQEACANTSPSVGVCLGELDKGLCTGHESNCEECEFEEDSSGKCTILQSNTNLDDWRKYPAFGRCQHGPVGDGGICLWSEDECPDQTYYMTPYSQSVDADKLPCTCDQVRVGACEFYPEVEGESNKAQVYCAISADACEEESTYIPAVRLIDDGRDCFLCEAFDHPATPPAPVAAPAPIAADPGGEEPIYYYSNDSPGDDTHDHSLGPPPKENQRHSHGVPPPEIVMHIPNDESMHPIDTTTSTIRNGVQPEKSTQSRMDMKVVAAAASFALVGIMILVMRRGRKNRQEERDYSRDHDFRLDGPSTFEMVPMYDDE